MATQTTATSYNSDVLHIESHNRLSQEEIAKAVARHQREHPARAAMSAASKPQKTTPRR